MPKGGVLHVHDSALTSLDFFYHNITFRPNLYMCEGGSLKFYRNAPESCTLLRKLRESPEMAEKIKKQIYDLFSMKDNYNGETETWNKFGQIFGFLKSILSYEWVWSSDQWFKRIHYSVEPFSDQSTEIGFTKVSRKCTMTTSCTSNFGHRYVPGTIWTMKKHLLVFKL